MCGRYVIEDANELSERLTNITLPPGFLDKFKPNWNASPTQVLPVVAPVDGDPEITTMQWGLIPFWTKPGEKPKVAPINARSETVAEKSMFKNLVKGHRCIVPANGFYEWRKVGSKKQPYFIHPTEGQLFLFAGLWGNAKTADGETFHTYTILTTNANDKMAYLHDRMPVILDDDGATEWLDIDLQEFEPLEHLLTPPDDDAIDYYAVSTDVNSPKNNKPENLEPIEVGQT